MEIRNEDAEAVQALYNQAVATETLEDQHEALEDMANEVGTTVEALGIAKAARDAAAAEQLKKLRGQQPPDAFEGNAGDDWRNPKG